MSAVMYRSDTQTVAQLIAHARHTDHFAERSKHDAHALKAREQEYRRELDLVMFGRGDHHGGNEL